MEIKVCGMRDLENIQEVLSEIAPDWMGVIFYPKSSRFVADSFAMEISKLKVKKVGVFVNTSNNEILEKIKAFGLSAVQLHGNESAEFVRELRELTSAEIWKVVSVKEKIAWESLEGYLNYVDRFLFDTATSDYGGSGRKFDWDILKTYPFKKGFLLSGGIDEQSVNEIMNLSKIQPMMLGVDLNSRFEIEPAIKDFKKLKQFKRRLMGQSPIKY